MAGQLGADGRFGAFRRQDDAASMWFECAAERRQPDRSGEPFDERTSKVALELPDLLRQGRLRDVQTARSASD